MAEFTFDYLIRANGFPFFHRVHAYSLKQKQVLRPWKRRDKIEEERNREKEKEREEQERYTEEYEREIEARKVRERRKKVRERYEEKI